MSTPLANSSPLVTQHPDEIGTAVLGRRPRIAFVCLKIYPMLKRDNDVDFAGGAELQQLLLGRELAKRGYDVSYITLDHGQGPVEQLEPFRVFAAYRPSLGVPGLRFFYPRLGGLLNAVRAANADIYYFRCAGFALAHVVWQARRMNRKSVFCGANDPDFDPNELRKRLSLRDRTLYQWGLRRCDAVVAQNQQQQRLLDENFGRQAELIYNGLPDLDEPSEQGRDILWIARFKEFKQPELFLDLARRLPNEHFVMIGGLSRSTLRERHLYTELERQAARLSNLEFLGFQPLDVVEQRLSGARLLVNTSRHEGFPNTFLQAWRRGVPVVSFVDPDRLIERHRLGRIVRTVGEMESVVRRVACGDERYEPAHIRSVFHDNLTIDAAVDRYENLFSSLADENRHVKRKTDR